MNIKDIINKSTINIEDIVTLLNIKNLSEDYFELIKVSNEYSRKTFKKGYIFAQVGLNAEKCSVNCKFCSLAKDHFAIDCENEKNIEEIIELTKTISKSNISQVFLMTTADYNKSKFLKIIEKVRNILPQNIGIVANIGDFDDHYARKLKAVGASGCYHIRRLREGIDTCVSPDIRENTIKAIINNDLELYYCIEPIGSEHSYEEIAKEIVFAVSLNINVMAAMKRVNINGGELSQYPEISVVELSKIVAVINLVVKPKTSMNVHEPNVLSMLAGVNQLYAEYGVNPRDDLDSTENGRGFNTAKVESILKDFEWELN